MQLVGVALGRGTPFQVADVRALVRHDERALELTRVRRVDAEIRRQLHGATHARRHVAERTVGEHGAVERREKVVAVRHHGPEVLLDELRMIAHGFAERAENDAVPRKLLAHRRTHRHGIEDRIDGHAREELLLQEGDAELLVRFQNLGIDVGERTQRRLLFRRREIARSLIVDRRIVHVRPVRFLHREPAPICLQTPLEHEGRLVLASRDLADCVFAQTRRQGVLLDVRDKACRVLAGDQAINSGSHPATSPNTP